MASPGICRKPVSTAMNMRPCGSSLGACLSLTGVRFHDIAASLQGSPVPRVTLTVLRVYQPDGLWSKFTGRRTDQGRHGAHQQEPGQKEARASNTESGWGMPARSPSHPESSAYAIMGFLWCLLTRKPSYRALGCDCQVPCKRADVNERHIRARCYPIYRLMDSSSKFP